MSDLLDLNLIRREELVSQSSFSQRNSPDTALEAHYYKRLEQLYQIGHDELETVDGSKACSSAVPSPGLDADAYHFRLFSKPADHGKVESAIRDHQRVALRSPTPTDREPSFVHPNRSNDYYFTGPSSAEQVDQFRQAALSGDQIIKATQMRWPGAEVPWKVITITKTGSFQTRPAVLEKVGSQKRRRSGKKRRIIIRKRVQVKSAEKLARRQSLAEKEAAEREKRTRRNREKKVKKKQKDKIKKSLEA